MTKCLILLPGPAMDIPEADWGEVGEASHTAVRGAKDAGVCALGERINDGVAPLMVAADGTVTKETYAQTEEFNGGFCVLELPSRDAALAWAAKIAGSCRCSWELRELRRDPGR